MTIIMILQDQLNVKSLSTGVRLNLEDDTAKTELQHNLHAFKIKVDPDNVDTNSNFRIEIDGSEKFRIQNNGNVGIGTTSPASKLHISSSNFNDHITLGRGSDELGISVSGAQILVEGGLSPFNNDSEDLGRSDKHWQDLYITDNIYVSQSATLTLNGELDVTGLISGSDINIDDWGSVSASLASIQTEGVEGSGTANHITKWSDSDTVTSSGMFQAASGNFSIGITTPNAKLSVVNDISIGTSATDVLRLHNESGVGTIDGYSTRSIAFGSATNGEVMRIDNTNGRIGIGTTTPNAKLHISSSGAALEFERDGQETYKITHGTSGLYFNRPDSSALAFGVTQNSDFDIFDTSANVMFRADASSGNVGIGTTNPQTPLHVEGLTRITDSGNTAFYSGNYVRLFNSQAFGFRNSASTTVAEINLSGDSYFNGGNVGIGTTSPSYKLDVESSDNIIAEFVSTTNKGAIKISDDDTTAYISAENSRIGFGTSPQLSTNNITILTTNNNVGIGTTNPDAKLDIEGDLQVKGINISNQENLDIDTGTETIATVVKANYDAAFFDYVVKNGTNLRAGTVMAVHDGYKRRIYR